MIKRASRRGRYEKGNASRYIKYREIFPGDLVLVVGRVSTGPQEANGNLKDQIAFLAEYVRGQSAMVLDTFGIAVSGWSPEWLFEPALIAKQNNAKILVESTDRLIRHPHYHSQRRPDLQAPETNLRELAEWADGVSLHTYLHPDATPREVRSHQRKRGQWAKNSYGGNFSKSHKASDPEIQRDFDRKAVWKLLKTLPL